MSIGRKYRKPPVVEALCEMFFEGSAWDDTVPGRIYDQIRPDFPQRHQLVEAEATVTVGARGEATAGVRQSHRARIRFSSPSGDRIVQVGENLLVVNQLPPYPRFEDWEPVVHQVLGVYREIARPGALTRLGVRYVNRIPLPMGLVALDDWFTIYPQLPREAGESHRAFMLRVELPGRADDPPVLVTFGSAPPIDAQTVSVILDLYATVEGRTFEPDAVPLTLRRAHDAIEHVFESCITDALRKRFEPEPPGEVPS